MRIGTGGAAIAGALVLAGCGSRDKGASITVSGSDGNTVAAIDGNTGEVNLNIPGLQGSLKLPKIKLDADNFDLNGVHLYPGSTISGFNVAANADGKGKDASGNVRVAFDSPAAPDTVRDWFRQRLAGVGYAVRPAGAGLAGVTDEHKPFRLDLEAAGDDRTHGTVVIGG